MTRPSPVEMERMFAEAAGLGDGECWHGHRNQEVEVTGRAVV